MNRQEELLRMAAEKFDDCSNPFDHSALSEHRVTSDECYDLSTGIASIIRGYLAAPKDVRMRVMLCGVAQDSGLDPDAVVHQMNKMDAMKRLNEL